MIRIFCIDNFKSLVGFSLPTNLGQFTYLIGLNGTGKSMLLHVFEFVHHS